MPDHFTPREIAELAAVPKRTVDQILQERLFVGVADVRARARRRTLPSAAVAFAHIVGRLRHRLDPPTRRRLAQALIRPPAERQEAWRFEVEPGLELDLTRLVGDGLERAHAYAEARDRFIQETPRGRAQIRDTHITVDAIQHRLAAGESIEAVVARYPILTPTVVAVAAIYARSHPALGRPPTAAARARDKCGGAAAARPV